MTIEPRPGCFGSILFYRAGAAECERCKVATVCRSALIERAPSVAQTVAQLDKRFSQERVSDLVPWLQKRLRRPDASAAERKQSKARETLESWKRDGLNVFELRHRMNPAPKNSIAYRVFQIMIDLKAFSRRDLIEELRMAENGNMTKPVATRQINTAVEALLEAGILKIEGRGILCLN